MHAGRRSFDGARSAARLVVALGCLGATSARGAEPPTDPGEYVARAGDCVACHTAPGGEPYAGGAALKTPFGTIYGPNLTPDAQTGLGSWSFADFEGVMRHGVGKDGRDIYPAMPYDSYTRMSDADIAALWAYLRSLPPIRRETPANDLAFPFSIRFSAGAWRELFLEVGRFEPTPGKSEAWNRGAYLVEGPGHCSGCHAPRNPFGAVEQSQGLAGAKIDTWYAPDISGGPASGIRDWSVDQLATYLKTGQNDRNVSAVGPMAQVVQESLAYLTDADVRSMAVYLKDQPTVAAPARPEPATVATARLDSGRQLYGAYCASCHQGDGRGIQGVAPALAGNSAVTASEPHNVVSAIMQGFPARAPWPAMPALAAALDDRQIADVVNYVRTGWGGVAEPNADPWLVASLRLQNEAPAAGSAEARFVCPSLGSGLVDPATRDALATLDGQAASPAELKGLVERYRAGHPGASRAAVVSAFMIGYCPVIDQGQGSYVDKGAKLVAFVGRVTRLLTATE